MPAIENVGRVRGSAVAAVLDSLERTALGLTRAREADGVATLRTEGTTADLSWREENMAVGEGEGGRGRTLVREPLLNAFEQVWGS